MARDRSSEEWQKLLAQPGGWRSVYRKLSFVEWIFVLLVALYFLIDRLAPNSIWVLVVQVAAFFFAAWVAIRWIRVATRKAIWRLRNRLLVTYLFIAVVPILLIAALAAGGAYVLTSQVSVYLVTSELDRRMESLRITARSLARIETEPRPEALRRMGRLFYSDRVPGIEAALREAGRVYRYPEDSVLEPPPDAWKSSNGIVQKDGRYYVWSYTRTNAGDLTVLLPLTQNYLSNLVPGFSSVYLGPSDTSNTPRPARKGPAAAPPQEEKDLLPPPVNRFDIEVRALSFYPAAQWDKPGVINDKDALLVVRTRPSAMLATLFSRKSDDAQNALPFILSVFAVLFLIVEIVCLWIGVSMTRTITGAVHHLYEGTQKVIEGDFSHRIDVQDNDQLADLSHSFNRMTENLERLVEVAKEKERLQSEIEIAREVQNQLYPKEPPATRTLRLCAVCQPARIVSGDYYDYETLRDRTVVLAIGDVAGKGISAALLMATLQSSLRAQLQGTLELAAAVGSPESMPVPSTSRLVSQLNLQLFSYTSPEKYATFYFALYDEPTGVLTYTNAGHLPPILFRGDTAHRLDVNGTVVGAFSFSRFEESRIDMQNGDVLVCFTDGITEPENAYGEMFGENRLIELVGRNVHRSEPQIIDAVMDAVHDWTGSPELQDDMTVLVARRH